MSSRSAVRSLARVPRRSTNPGDPGGPSGNCPSFPWPNCPRRAMPVPVRRRSPALRQRLAPVRGTQDRSGSALLDGRPDMAHANIHRRDMSPVSPFARRAGSPARAGTTSPPAPRRTDVVEADGLCGGQRAAQPSDYLETKGGATVGHAYQWGDVNDNSVRLVQGDRHGIVNRSATDIHRFWPDCLH